MSCFSLDNVRLGAFLVLGAALVLATVLFFTVRDRRRAEILVVTYFNEAVGGLETDSPVRYRGVQVGKVEHITIAPDKIHVEVLMALHLDVLERLGFDRQEVERRMGGGGMLAADGLRATLKGNVITGRLYVELDFFKDPPAPFEPKDFTPEYTYLPAADSSMKMIEQDLTAVLAHLPRTLAALDGLLGRFDEQLKAADLPGLVATARKAVVGLELGTLSGELRQAVKDADLAGLSGSVKAAAATVAARADGVGKRIEAVLAADGPITALAAEATATLAALKQAAAAVKPGETAEGLRAGIARLEKTLDEVRLLIADWQGVGAEVQDAFRVLRRLGGTLADEPESLIFGPRPAPEEEE